MKLVIKRALSSLHKHSAVLAIVVLAIVSATTLTHQAWSYVSIELERGGRGYVTDEVWYVSSARVILLKIFGVEPRQSPEDYGATLIFQRREDSLGACAVAQSLRLFVKCNYREINATYVRGERSRVLELISIARSNYSLVDVIPGWEVPDHKGINNYINWEHPPLAKYTVALSMALLGDHPLYWRIPIIAFGCLGVVLVYLVLLKLTRSVITSLLGALLFLADNITRAIYSIAILDGFVATLTALALYYTLREGRFKAIITSVIAGLFKYTGLFASIPLIVLLARREARSARGGLGDFVYYLVYYGVLIVALYISALVVASTPIMYYMGVSSWFKHSLLGSLSWHLTVKCVGANCPISSSPWDWLLGYNSFPLFIYPDGRALKAEAFYPLWFATLVLTLVSLPLAYSKRDYGKTTLYLLGVYAGYIAIWVLGARTQYSFYAIQLAPLIYVNLFYLIHTYTKDSSAVQQVLSSWKSSMSNLVKVLETLMLQ